MEMIDEFDEMVDRLLNGDVLMADFDSGVIITVNTEQVGITLDLDDEILDIILQGEEVDYLHLFLEAMFVANKGIKDVNWDSFLEGLSEGR